MAPLYKLYYFDMMGYAEPIRLVLAAANVEYEDVRVAREKWPEIKDTIPWGKVPALQLSDGSFLCQSSAIIQYLARKYNLAGSNDLEAAKCSEYAGVIQDLRNEQIKFFFEKNEETKAELKATIIEKSFPAFCNNFVTILQKNGDNGHLIGDKLTSADIELANMISQVRRLFEIPVEKYPELAAFEESVHSQPGIKEWIEKRPKTEW